jgi:DNA (cytosine-5)-methyltransferase 1
MAFTFVDLFAGIGGFHGALTALGGECVFASEIDPSAARIYLRNWGIDPSDDITQSATEFEMKVPPHDVLVGGFPCQPFSKSGKQNGMEEARGTLFWNIAKIIERHRPSLVLLENVRNIAGPRHIHEWEIIVQTLRDLGYAVSDKPLVVSPHDIHPNHGGRPQNRGRVLICATLIPKGTKVIPYLVGIPSMKKFTAEWQSSNWNLRKNLPLDRMTRKSDIQMYQLSNEMNLWIDAWSDFVVVMNARLKGKNLPGFPIWVDAWTEVRILKIAKNTPVWKENFLRKNAQFYTENRRTLDAWLKRWHYLQDFPPSRRKFEWQAQSAKNLDETILHFRPSGIRAKAATYTPALVAINQTSVLAKQRRKLTVREAARLQGFPEWFDFGGQSNNESYKQLGNAVNIGVIYNALKAQVLRDLDLLGSKPALVQSILGSMDNPDSGLQAFKHFPNPSYSAPSSDRSRLRAMSDDAKERAV